MNSSTPGRLAMLLLGTGLIGGCTSRRPLLTPPPIPIVWPKPPDAARVRYLDQVAGSEDVQETRSLGEVVGELVYGPEKPSMLVSPIAVAVHADGQRFAIADTQGLCVHLFDLRKPSYQRLDGCAGEPFQTPAAVCYAGDELWAADAKAGGIAVFAGGGGQRWVGRGHLTRPAGMAWCASNDLVYVTDAATDAVLAFERSGSMALRFGGRGGGDGQFNGPTHVACAADGEIVVSDSLNFRVQRFGVDGSYLGGFGRKGDAAGDLALPKGVAYDADGNVWVVDAHFENVQAFNREGQLLMMIGGEGHDPGEFWLPSGICIDAQRRIWVADTYNNRVQVFELLP